MSRYISKYVIGAVDMLVGKVGTLVGTLIGTTGMLIGTSVGTT
jgi:hypothetical protein